MGAKYAPVISTFAYNRVGQTTIEPSWLLALLAWAKANKK